MELLEATNKKRGDRGANIMVLMFGVDVAEGGAGASYAVQGRARNFFGMIDPILLLGGTKLKR